MQDRFDALDFAEYAASRWRWVAITCAVAIGLAGIVSALLPKRYTATASVMIDPPAGTDPRAATSVSPVYLDSLKTFERLASSDTLFREALDRLKLRDRFAGRSVESLKSSMLHITRPVNTRIIEIGATLDDPRAAQQLAQYIAEKTVALNEALDEHSATDVLKDAEAVLARARLRVAEAEKSVSELAGTETLRADMQTASDMKYRAERDLSEIKTDVTVQGAQASAAVRARVTDLQAQADAWERTLQAKGLLLDRRDALDSELRLARANLEQARSRADEIRTSSAFRGERLSVLDPGVVPERPSYPNTPLNLLIAFLLAVVSSALWLAARFGYERAQVMRTARSYSLR